MLGSAYERVSDSDTDEDLAENSSQHSRVQPHRDLVVQPPVYYGDGPFDPPSSEEDSDEERFLRKSEHHEALNPREFADSEPGNVLRVGGAKVSTLCNAMLVNSLFTSRLASDGPEVSHILSGFIGALVCLHWRVRRHQSLQWKAIPPPIERAQGIA